MELLKAQLSGLCVVIMVTSCVGAMRGHAWARESGQPALLPARVSS